MRRLSEYDDFKLVIRFINLEIDPLITGSTPSSALLNSRDSAEWTAVDSAHRGPSAQRGGAGDAVHDPDWMKFFSDEVQNPDAEEVF